MLVLKIQEDGATTLSLPLWEGDRFFGRLPAIEGQRYQIGKDLGDPGKTISRTHATVRSTKLGDNYEVRIHDGTEHEPSGAGVWIHGQRITGWVTLQPGTEVDLLKGYVLMLLQDQDTDRGSDLTYSQEDLVNEMAGQLVRLEDAVSLINQKCNDLAVQLEHRERIDQDQQSALSRQQTMAEQHSAEIRKLYRGIRGLIVLGFSVAAISMLVYGFLRLEKDNRTDLISLLGTVVVPVILGASALLVKNKTTP
jgi:pSer/pThr/pTyr-binding forkhead associated (FHA) protein